eukprot:scaffold969_cov106-Isochrysis_galbana.AAC.3
MAVARPCKQRTTLPFPPIVPSPPAHHTSDICRTQTSASPPLVLQEPHLRAFSSFVCIARPAATTPSPAARRRPPMSIPRFHTGAATQPHQSANQPPHTTHLTHTYRQPPQSLPVRQICSSSGSSPRA